MGRPLKHLHEGPEPLMVAVERTFRDDWQYRASGQSLLSQATMAVAALEAMSRGRTPITAEDVTPDLLRRATSAWHTSGLAPSTIQKRLNCLHKLGVHTTGHKVVLRHVPKWYLKESERFTAICTAEAMGFGLLSSLIAWTTRTGLRIEESLRLRWTDIDGNGVHVPGTKTSMAEATLPLGKEARFALPPKGDVSHTMVFPISYQTLANQWDCLRKAMGWDAPTCTLKALRRSAARYLHVDRGMPIAMVQQYLRHKDIQTTMRYLHLTGGYGTEEMGKYL